MHRETSSMTLLICQMYSQSSMKITCNCKERMLTCQIKSAVSTFLSKSQLFKWNLSGLDVYQFPSLYELEKAKNIPDDDLQVYCARQDKLQRDWEILGSFITYNTRLGDQFILGYQQWGNRCGRGGTGFYKKWHWVEARVKKKSYQDFWLKKKIWLLSSIEKQGQDVIYCLPNIIFGGTGLLCSRFASFQAKKQTENYWTWGSTTSS